MNSIVHDISRNLEEFHSVTVSRTRKQVTSEPNQEMCPALRTRCGAPYTAARQTWGWVITVVALSCVMLACGATRNQSAPAIEFTRAPLAGEGGPDRTDIIEGRVIGARPGQRIVLFAHWGTWWVQPRVDQPFTIIKPDSTWRNSTHLGTQYAALLVDANYQPPANMDSLPATGLGVVAVAVVEGRPVFWQTWWFLFTATLASAALATAYSRSRMLRLAKEEERFREAIDTIPAMTFTTASDGSRTFVNKRWAEYAGLSVEQSSGAGWQRAIHPDDLASHSENWFASVASGQLFEHEARFRRAVDGEYRWFLVRGVPLLDHHGRIVKWYGTLTDIEDRKRSEEQRERLRQLEADLAHINRVSTMGEMAASLAHEIKQPLAAAITSANSCIEWLAHEPPNLARARAAAAKIDKYGNRAAEIIDHIRSLYKKSPSQRELVDVNEIVHEIFTLLQGEAVRHCIEMRTELATALPKIKVDRVQLQQVFMNLMLNSIEAMRDEGGELTVKSQRQDGQLLFSVSDTGLGLPAGNVDQVFSAFFTTKPQGSGMGLAISRSIVESHGGRLWATTNDGLGATFQFTLPSEVQ